MIWEDRDTYHIQYTFWRRLDFQGCNFIWGCSAGLQQNMYEIRCDQSAVEDRLCTVPTYGTVLYVTKKIIVACGDRYVYSIHDCVCR